MKDFFKVTDLNNVLELQPEFSLVKTETVSITETFGRVLAEDIVSDMDLPNFTRSIMDGYAVKATSTFGASESNPAYLEIKGSIAMGESPDFSVRSGEAAKIATGGMLPDGTDAVVMVEHTEILDNSSIEIYKSVAPGQNIVEKGEDFQDRHRVLNSGQKLRAQEIGLLAAFGKETVTVFKKPVIGIISTGDEIVPIDSIPEAAQVRDINTYTLSSQIQAYGAVPHRYGIVRDDFDALLKTCKKALAQSDMVVISGGSSIGMRDFTIDVLSALPNSEILVHGVSISPGKPTILAKANNKPFWGLPGHVTSTMVVFTAIVKPFLQYIAGISQEYRQQTFMLARLTRNISSAQGRVDYIRVRLLEEQGILWAEPVLGKSGLINTLVKADGLIAVDINSEGLEKDAIVNVTPV